MARSPGRQLSLRFSGIALMAGVTIWNKSPPLSVMADQTMKKALIKRADTRLVACFYVRNNISLLFKIEKANYVQRSSKK